MSENQRAREKNQKKPIGRLPSGGVNWTLVAAWVGVIVLATAVLLRVFKEGFSPLVKRRDLAGWFAGGDEPGRAKDWNGMLPVDAARKFIAAETHGERLKLVRAPDRVGTEMEEFFSWGAGSSEEVVQVKSMGNVTTDWLNFDRYHVKLKGGGDRLLCVIIDEQEGAKVDFASYARRGSASWDQLLSGKAPEANVVRVFLQRGTYYNQVFSDDEKWRHFVATSPDLEWSVDCYVERGTEGEKQLNEFTAKGMHRVTVGIRSLEESHVNRQFEIGAVHAPGWVIVEDDRPGFW